MCREYGLTQWECLTGYSTGQLSVKLQPAHGWLQYMRKAFNMFSLFGLKLRTCSLSNTSWGLDLMCTSIQLVQALCVQHQSWQKRRSSLNFARIQKCQKRRWHYFLISRGLCFLTFFDTGKTDWARPFPSFSCVPHATYFSHDPQFRQEDVSRWPKNASLNCWQRWC